jgi:DNA-directed RNA polymerase subunit RPC12/RpoP
MSLLRKRQQQPGAGEPPAAPEGIVMAITSQQAPTVTGDGQTITEQLEDLAKTAGKPSLFAHSDFVKQVDCPRCGATKQLASATAYLYCDHCGSLIDYDFRQANADTNAGITNTVYHRLVAPAQPELNQARLTGNEARYRELQKGVFAEWIRQCPQAVSPRARSDQDFADRMAAYLAESAVRRDFEPSLAALDRQMNAVIAGLERWPNGDGPWRVSQGIWQVAALFKEQMEKTYALLDLTGVLAMDPDEAPPGVPLRMEFSTFCQGWVPHLAPDDAERMLEFFGLSGKYARVRVTDLDARNCGGCGAELETLPGAQAVVCQGCGRKLDLGGGQIPCRNCGAPLSFPVGVSALDCPYCQSGTHRL